MAYVVGRTADERHLVHFATFREPAVSPQDEPDLNDDEAFTGKFELYHLDRRVHEIPAEAAAAEVKLKRRVGVSPVLVQNTLDVTIKVQSSNSATNDYDDLTIPPRTEKSFNYFVESDAFFVREQATSRLLLSLDPKTPGFGFKPIRV